MIHVLKTDPQMWKRLADGEKTFELRRDDRGYQRGDELWLYAFDRTGSDHDCSDPKCGGNWRSDRRTRLRFTVGFVAKGTFYGLPLGDFAVLSLIPMNAQVASDG